MEEKKLTEVLEESGLPERTRMILALMPGALFGFLPPNAEKMIERVDCQTCRKIMATVEKICQELKALDGRVEELGRPARDRNKARIEDYLRRSRRFVIGYFARSPELEPMPDFQSEPWYEGAVRRVDDMEAELAALAARDAAHWGDEDEREISREAIGRFVAKDSWYQLSI